MIPEGWTVKRLGSVATLQRGFDLPKSQRLEGKVPIVSSSGISGYHNEAKAQAPGVVTGRYGSIGKVYFILEDYWPLNTSLWVKDFHDNDEKFIYYLLSRFDFHKFSDKTGVPGINRNDLHTVKVSVPPFYEQQKITRIFSIWDKAISTSELLLENSQKQKKGLIQQLMTEKKRLSQFSCHWKEAELGSLTSIYDGTHTTPKYVEKGVPFYSVEHLTANDFSRTKFISEAVFQKENKRVKIERGDILMTRIGDIGTAKHLDWDVSASFYVSLALLKVGQEVDSQFLVYFVSSDFFHRELWQRTIHVAFPKKINLGEIGKCRVLFPSLDEQREIASVLLAADEEIKNLQQKITHLKQEKKALMQQLLTGKRRVKLDLSEKTV